MSIEFEARCGIFMRTVAFLIDAAVVGLVSYAAVSLYLSNNAASMVAGADWQNTMKIIWFAPRLFEAVALLYAIIHLLYFSTEVLLAGSPGKLLLGMRIRESMGYPAERRAMLVRFIIKHSPVILAGLGALIDLKELYLGASFMSVFILTGCIFVLSQGRQAFHDLCSDTAVYPAWYLPEYAYAAEREAHRSGPGEPELKPADRFARKGRW